MIPVICIPSMIRYWYRKIFGANTTYDSIWFECWATQLGTQLNLDLKGSKYDDKKL